MHSSESSFDRQALRRNVNANDIATLLPTWARFSRGLCATLKEIYINHKLHLGLLHIRHLHEEQVMAISTSMMWQGIGSMLNLLGDSACQIRQQLHQKRLEPS